eukprot:15378466-Heterocapsa_arctica.AAC.1
MTVQLSYELHDTQEKLHAAHCRWESDSARVSAQIVALQSEISEALERSSSAFTRDRADHARAIMALEDRMALHN